MEKLLPDLLKKNPNGAFLRINNPKFYTVFFCCMLSSGLSIHVETKLQTTFFYLT